MKLSSAPFTADLILSVSVAVSQCTLACCYPIFLTLKCNPLGYVLLPAYAEGMKRFFATGTTYRYFPFPLAGCGMTRLLVNYWLLVPALGGGRACYMRHYVSPGVLDLLPECTIISEPFMVRR